MKNINEMEALKAINDLSDEELEDVVGASGVIKTVSKECKMNTWQFVFTCCAK
ncbi:lacticin 481 family lantibiotic [Halalkalibacterium halodurans]|uniref:lacticin 481 family lantibiotic n=1 Tax=Halalkalibacterium halodurans TaxID=86665 RepID=UPI002E1EEC6A|nr:lacticin 481 family lantibiotic [Halalkalibacterium halodurans]